jgi:hypothetical protein
VYFAILAISAHQAEVVHVHRKSGFKPLSAVGAPAFSHLQFIFSFFVWISPPPSQSFHPFFSLDSFHRAARLVVSISPTTIPTSSNDTQRVGNELAHNTSISG